MINYYKGLYAEKIAAILLLIKGYKILDSRFKSKIGEIDLICSKNKKIIFAEVKFRHDKQALIDVITYKQQRRIINTANLYLQTNKLYDRECRIDVIFISPPFYLKHILNAF